MNPLTGYAKILTVAIGAPKYLDGPLPPTFRLSWRCPQKQEWQHLQFFPWSAQNSWTRLSPSRIKPMRPGIPLSERIRCTHKFQGQRRCGEACGERFEKWPASNFPLCHAWREVACAKACPKNMACRRFLTKPCGYGGSREMRNRK